VSLIVETKDSGGVASSEYIQDMSTASLRLYNVEIEDAESEISYSCESTSDASNVFVASDDEVNQHGKLEESTERKKITKKTMKYQFELTFLADGHKTMVFECKTLRKRNKYCLAIQEMLEVTKQQDLYHNPLLMIFGKEVDSDGNNLDEGKILAGLKGSSSITTPCKSFYPRRSFSSVSLSPSSVGFNYSFSDVNSSKSSISSLASWASSLPQPSAINGSGENLCYESYL